MFVVRSVDVMPKDQMTDEGFELPWFRLYIYRERVLKKSSPLSSTTNIYIVYLYITPYSLDSSGSMAVRMYSNHVSKPILETYRIPVVCSLLCAGTRKECFDFIGSDCPHLKDSM